MSVILGRYRLPDDVMFTPVEDEYVFLHVGRGEYFSLNPVARFMFDLMQDGLTETEIIARCIAEYDTDTATVARDLAALVEELAASGILEVEEPSGG